MTTIQRLSRFDNCGRRQILRILPQRIIKIWLIILVCHSLNSRCNIFGIATKRNNNAVPFLDCVIYFRCPGRNHNRYQKFVMALSLEVSKIQCVIVYLVVCGLTILCIATFKLQKENYILIKHNHINAFAHSRNCILKNNSSVLKCAQLIFENPHLGFPCVALLNCGFCRYIVGMNNAKNFTGRLMQEI